MSVSDAERERDTDTDRKREKGARHAMGTMGNKKTNNYGSVSSPLSLLSLFLHPSIPSLAHTARGNQTASLCFTTETKQD